MGVKEGQKCRQNGRNGTGKEVNFRYAYDNKLNYYYSSEIFSKRKTIH